MNEPKRGEIRKAERLACKLTGKMDCPAITRKGQTEISRPSNARFVPTIWKIARMISTLKRICLIAAEAMHTPDS